MAIDTTTRRTRRAVLAGAVGGVGTIVATVLGRPLAVRAVNGDPVLMGNTNTCESTTTITTVGGTGLTAQNSSELGVGLLGEATHATSATSGVQGFAHSPAGFGSFGWSVDGVGTGLAGYSGPAINVPSSLPKTGVLGKAMQAGGRGGVFQGKAAQVKLRPSSASTHAPTGQRGDLFVDSLGRLWFCKGGTTWKQLA